MLTDWMASHATKSPGRLHHQHSRVIVRDRTNMAFAPSLRVRRIPLLLVCAPTVQVDRKRVLACKPFRLSAIPHAVILSAWNSTLNFVRSLRTAARFICLENSMAKLLSLIVGLLLLGTALVSAEERTVPLKGVYKEINTKREMQAIATFMKGSDEDKETLAETIQEHPERYAPAVFFHLSRYLFEQEEEDDALFWLYAARIRTWYDIKRCTDPSVGDSVEMLNGQLPPLLRLIQFEDLDHAKRQMKRAIAWDRKTAHKYDARWIALHGIRASLPTAADGKQPTLTIPEEKWEELAETHRKEYHKTWLEDLKSLTPEQMTQIEAKIESLREEAEAAAESEEE